RRSFRRLDRLQGSKPVPQDGIPIDVHRDSVRAASGMQESGVAGADRHRTDCTQSGNGHRVQQVDTGPMYPRGWARAGCSPTDETGSPAEVRWRVRLRLYLGRHAQRLTVVLCLLEGVLGRTFLLVAVLGVVAASTGAVASGAAPFGGTA